MPFFTKEIPKQVRNNRFSLFVLVTMSKKSDCVNVQKDFFSKISMKRENHLYEQIVDYSNIRLAFIKALKRKRNSLEVFRFCMNVEKKLNNVQERLKSESPKFGNYHQFKIFDPKERIISSVPFDQRIMHHAIMNVLEPIFEKQMIFHTYACRKGKGSHRAIEYAYTKALKEVLKPAGYVRYMDDMIVFGKSKEELKILYFAIEKFIGTKLKLTLKPRIINSTKNGIPFLGYRITNRGIFLLQKSKKRIKRNLQKIDYLFKSNQISEEKAGESANSVLAVKKHCCYYC